MTLLIFLFDEIYHRGSGVVPINLAKRRLTDIRTFLREAQVYPGPCGLISKSVELILSPLKNAQCAHFIPIPHFNSPWCNIIFNSSTIALGFAKHSIIALGHISGIFKTVHGSWRSPFFIGGPRNVFTFGPSASPHVRADCHSEQTVVY